MKFFIINSFRLMVYIAYLTTIVGGLLLAYYNAVPQEGAMMTDILGMTGTMAQVVTFAVIAVVSWVAASVVAGLIVTILDIRDDINDRLPDARRDD
jgi:hypothetical protein